VPRAGPQRRGGGQGPRLTFEIEKITDMNRYVDFGVAMTPALAVDGKVKVVGKVASVDEIKMLLK